MNKILKYITTVAIAIVLFACEEKPAPYLGDDTPAPAPNFPVYTVEDFGGERITIADLKAMHTIASSSVAPTEITENLIVTGIIVGDDESGNIYKSLYLQDETGGINLAINQVNLYNIMPVGQKVFIKLKGLYIGDYAGTHQIGFKQLSGEHKGDMGRWDWAWELYKDPETGEYPFKHYYPSGLPNKEDLPEPTIIKSARNLDRGIISTLVRVDSVSFGEDGGFATWSVKEENTNLTMLFNDGSSLTVRTSGYSNFYADTIPQGRGSLMGILSYHSFGGGYQLYIRTREDILFDKK